MAPVMMVNRPDEDMARVDGALKAAQHSAEHLIGFSVELLHALTMSMKEHDGDGGVDLPGAVSTFHVFVSACMLLAPWLISPMWHPYLICFNLFVFFVWLNHGIYKEHRCPLDALESIAHKYQQTQRQRQRQRGNDDDDEDDRRFLREQQKQRQRERNNTSLTFPQRILHDALGVRLQDMRKTQFLIFECWILAGTFYMIRALFRRHNIRVFANWKIVAVFVVSLLVLTTPFCILHLS
jgi:hypothetical protein